MFILSILQDRIQILKEEKRFLKKPKILLGKANIASNDYKTFNVDKWALYLKQALDLSVVNHYSKQKVKLILGIQFFEFQRIEIPANIAIPGIELFLKKKTEEFSEKIEIYKFYLAQNRGKTYAHVYALSSKKLGELKTLLSFYDLSIEEIYPEAVLIFQLFNQTLSSKKEEPLLFLEYNKTISSGCVFDYLGLRDNKPVKFETKNIIEEIKKINLEYKGSLSRLILSGEMAGKIRQDNFTKETGVWTNPLLKIIGSSTYAALAKKLHLEEELIAYSREMVLLGMIKDKKTKDIALLPEKKVTFKLPQISKINLNTNFSQKINMKTVFGWLIIMIFSAILTYSGFFGIMYLQKHPPKLSLSFPKAKTIPKKTEEIKKRATPTLAKKITPTVMIDRKKIIIEIQNGVGTAGLASKLKAILEKNDYVIENTGNADSYKYKKSVIIAPSKNIFDVIYKDLKSYFTSKPTFEETNDKKTTVIIGTDLNL